MSRLLLAALVFWVAVPATGHQPVQDMAPRWSGGYGFQLRHEVFGSDDLLDGSSDAEDPLDRKTRTHITWLEGVYTFDKSVRVTAKIPWVDKERITGTGERQSSRGLGDIIVGVPLKSYWNRGGETGNFGFTPSVRLPTGSTNGDFPVGDGSWDLGASFSYTRETPSWYELVDLFYWKNGTGKSGIHRGDELGFDINLGIHPLHRNADNSGLFLMWDVSARYEGKGRDLAGTTGGRRVHTGPVGVVYWHNWVARAEFKYPVYESVYGTQLARGPMLNFLVGVTF